MRTKGLTDERGSVLVIVAAFMAVAVLMLAAVVDLGDMRQEKKEVTLSTDAAALAAASTVKWTDPSLNTANTPVLCSSVDVDASVPNTAGFTTVADVVTSYLAANGGTSSSGCHVVRTGTGRGYVVVRGAEFVQYKVASSTGGSVGGISVAAIDSTGVGGLYPIGLCKRDGVTSIVNAGAYNPPPFVTVNLDFSNDNCGGSGNHVQIDFAGNPPPGQCPLTLEGSFCPDIKNGGFRGTIPNSIGSNPGSDWSKVDTELNILKTNGTKLWIPVVGDAVDNGNGATFPLEYFIEAVITRFEHTGNDQGFDFLVLRVVDRQSYIALTQIRPTPRLCAVSDDAAKIAASCGGTTIVLPPTTTTTTTTTTSTTTTSTTSTSTTSTTTPATTTTTAPCALLSLSPLDQSVNVDNSSKKTTEAKSWTVTLQSPASCGTVSGRLVLSGQTDILFGTSTPASGSVTMTLPIGTTFPSGTQQGATWSVRFFRTSGQQLNTSAPSSSAVLRSD